MAVFKLDSINTNNLVLTPNRRLAAYISNLYKQNMASKGHKVWPTANILPLATWLQNLWINLEENIDQELPLLLSEMQERLVWEKIVRSSKLGGDLLKITPTAKHIQQAWQVLITWNLSLQDISTQTLYLADPSVFLLWAEEFVDLCDKKKWIDFSSMINILIKYLSSSSSGSNSSSGNFLDNKIFKLPIEIYLLNFDEFTPQCAKLLDNLAQLGVKITRKRLTSKCKKINKIALSSSEEEWQISAKWAKQQLNNPDFLSLKSPLIGIVIPELQTCRKNITRIFSQILPANSYNISAPLPLSNYGLIDAALLVLELLSYKIEYRSISQLLRSPFIGDAELEMFERNLLDRYLRENIAPNITFKYLLKYLENKKYIELSPLLILKIKKLYTILNKTKTKKFAEQWIKIFENALQIMGWPGERKLTRTEEHLASCWQNILKEYLQLGIVVSKHSYQEALGLIKRIIVNTPFLPETGEVKIHVLGLLEAAGIPFTKLWVAGVHRDAWPLDANPNPFIPISIQRKYSMPHSSSVRELEVAVRLTDTFCHSGTDSVIFSYPKTLGDFSAAPSELITEFIELKIVNIIKEDFKINNLNNNLNNNNLNNKKINILENQIQEKNINISFFDCSLETESAGGVSILQQQAQCPFKAFAFSRLGLKKLKTPSNFLSLGQRGEIVHQVLQLFWQDCKTKQNLIRLVDIGELKDFLNKKIELILNKWQKKLPHILDDNYIIIESKRLNKIIFSWLAQEFKRDEFNIYSLEFKQAINIGPLVLNIRVDRIDQLANGDLAIIDYKTGQASVASWFGDRPDDPQLPIYCSSNYNTSAVAYAVVQAKNQVFKGLSREENILPGVECENDWEQQVQNWRKVLTNLAGDYSQGVIAVDPKNDKSCYNCGLYSLCRVEH